MSRRSCSRRSSSSGLIAGGWQTVLWAVPLLASEQRLAIRSRLPQGIPMDASNKRRQLLLRLALTLVALTLILFVYVVVFVVPARMATEAEIPNARARLAAQNDIRGTLVQALVGLALLVGAAGTAFFSARTISLNREGQITDRFTKATSQLGDDQVDVRIGGIYALERIARDSQKDHWPIMEVLAAFLRRPSELQPEGTSELKDRGRDIQAAIRVIGRRKWFDGEPDRLDLWRADLRWLDMRDVRLNGANLGRALLERAGLRGADLRGATLRRARMKGARLHKAHFEDADLSNADLEEAVLEGPEYRGGIVDGPNFERALLRGTNLRRAQLPQSHLEGADLTGALLEGADLSQSSADAKTLWPDGFDPVESGVRVH